MILLKKVNMLYKKRIFKINQRILLLNVKEIVNKYQHNVVRCYQINKIPEKILDFYKKNYHDYKTLLVLLLIQNYKIIIFRMIR